MLVVAVVVLTPIKLLVLVDLVVEVLADKGLLEQMEPLTLVVEEEVVVFNTIVLTQDMVEEQGVRA